MCRRMSICMGTQVPPEITDIRSDTPGSRAERNHEWMAWTLETIVRATHTVNC